jgi:drug/metabolite transporter (DMT)-like permease
MMSNQAGDKDYLKGILFALLAVVLWSGNFIAARALQPGISPVSLAFFRWTTAVIVLFPFAYTSFKKEWKIILQHAGYIALTALTGVTLFNTLIYIAGKYTTATNLALIGTTASPVFVLLISGIFLRQRLAWNQILGAAICITGIFILISRGKLYQLGNFHFTKGDGWIFLAAFSFAIYTILVRRKPKEISAPSFLFAIFLTGTIFLVPVYLFDLSANKVEWNQKIILAVLYLGIGASVIAFLAWNISIKKLGPTRTALFGNLIPVFSTVEAALLLNETINRWTLICMAIVVAGILIATLKLNTRITRREKV